MEDIDWDSVKIKVSTMLEGNAEVGDIPDDVVTLANMLITTGDNNSSTRDSLTNSIKDMLKPYAGYPWKRGNQGILPAAARAVVDSACSEISAAAREFFSATSQYTQPLIRKHGKSKGSPVYADADEYAAELAGKARRSATQLFKDGEWDGTLAGLAACASYDAVAEED